MEKYGFVYIWYDSKRKMYYIGSHWGTKDDGYICSSNRMRNAYRRRPQDFKRRIIKSNINREELLNEEYKWIRQIDKVEYGNKYYNLKYHKPAHWSVDEYNRMSIGQKISNSLKGNIPWNKGKKGISHTENSKKLLRENALIQWQTRSRKMSEETKEKIRKAKIGKTPSEETKKRMSETHKIRCKSETVKMQLKTASNIRWKTN